MYSIPNQNQINMMRMSIIIIRIKIKEIIGLDLLKMIWILLTKIILSLIPQVKIYLSRNTILSCIISSRVARLVGLNI